MFQSQPAHDPKSIAPIQNEGVRVRLVGELLMPKLQRIDTFKFNYEAAVRNCHYCGQPTNCTDGIVPVCPTCDVLSAKDMARLLQQGQALLNRPATEQ